MSHARNTTTYKNIPVYSSEGWAVLADPISAGETHLRTAAGSSAHTILLARIHLPAATAKEGSISRRLCYAILFLGRVHLHYLVASTHLLSAAAKRADPDTPRSGHSEEGRC